MSGDNSMSGISKNNAYLPIYIVDAFTSKPFAGNPAAVCLEKASINLSDAARQNIAREMNLSETAFLQKIDNNCSYSNGDRFRLRWFTPTREVPLCGHATLASSAVLFQSQKNPNTDIVFETLSGELTATRTGVNDELITLNLPLNPPEIYKERDEINDLLKLFLPNPDESIQEILYSAATKKLLVRLKDTFTVSDLEELQPNTSKMLEVYNTGHITGVILTLYTATRTRYDFVSRYFAPWNGIPEDPVTGSAHTLLAPYWSEKLNRKELLARQCSPRGGELRLCVRDDGRLDVAGPACVFLSGEICVQL